MGSLPPLERALVDRGLLPDGERPDPEGPRRWWGGPLDVEGLILASVDLVCRAVDHVTGRPGFATTRASLAAAAVDSLRNLRVDTSRAPVFDPLSAFFPTADGWLRTHANYPHHQQRLLAALGVNHFSGVQTALSALGTREAEARILARGGIAAAVRPRARWLGSMAWEGPATTASWIEVETAPAGGGRTWEPDTGPGMPLRGLRVLDLTRVIAGPIASRTLAALGADVLRVDPPHLPEIVEAYIDTGFGKRSALADLRSESGSARIQELLGDTDVLLAGYRPGSLEAYGFGANELRQAHPHLVVVRVAAWGSRTAWAPRRGFDSIVQAATGIADIYRAADGTPGALPVQALDHATGYGMAATAIALAAARHRDGIVGHGQLTLSGTADVLIDASPPGGEVVDVEHPPTHARDSDYGMLQYSPPPFDLAGAPLDYAHPPRLYGSDELTWDVAPQGHRAGDERTDVLDAGAATVAAPNGGGANGGGATGGGATGDESDGPRRRRRTKRPPRGNGRR